MSTPLTEYTKKVDENKAPLVCETFPVRKDDDVCDCPCCMQIYIWISICVILLFAHIFKYFYP